MKQWKQKKIPPHHFLQTDYPKAMWITYLVISCRTNCPLRVLAGLPRTSYVTVGRSHLVDAPCNTEVVRTSEGQWGASEEKARPPVVSPVTWSRAAPMDIGNKHRIVQSMLCVLRTGKSCQTVPLFPIRKWSTYFDKICHWRSSCYPVNLSIAYVGMT
jgi:hypothetical protein